MQVYHEEFGRSNQVRTRLCAALASMMIICMNYMSARQVRPTSDLTLGIWIGFECVCKPKHDWGRWFRWFLAGSDHSCAYTSILAGLTLSGLFVLYSRFPSWLCCCMEWILEWINCTYWEWWVYQQRSGSDFFGILWIILMAFGSCTGFWYDVSNDIIAPNTESDLQSGYDKSYSRANTESDLNPTFNCVTIRVIVKSVRSPT